MKDNDLTIILLVIGLVIGILCVTFNSAALPVPEDELPDPPQYNSSTGDYEETQYTGVNNEEIGVGGEEEPEPEDADGYIPESDYGG